MPPAGRVKKLIEVLHEDGLTGAIIRSDANIFYLTGYRGSGLLFIPLDGLPLLYVSPLYYELAEESLSGDVQLVKLDQQPVIDRILDGLPDSVKARLGYDSLSAEDYIRLSERLGGSIISISDRLWKLRMIKEEDELEKIRRACEISSRCMELASEIISEGVTEAEVKAEILKEMMTLGGEKPAFDIIVASGPNSSKPHGAPGNRTIESGDIVVVDLGVVYEGYCSDMTRSFYVGDKPEEEMIRVYEAVVEAKREAERMAKLGVKAAELYEKAYERLASAGYGEHFLHGLGHGVGIEIHEPPRLKREAEEILSEGMVITIEPGVYLPKKFGIRIEDTLLVLRDGVEKLTSASYELTLP